MIHPPISVDVHRGPLLLSGIERGPGLAAHRARVGALPEPGVDALVRTLGEVGVRGRGGAGFPLARKLQTVVQARGDRAGLGGRRPYLVVNAAEGEPASAKDSALIDVAPHLVLDGAVVAAQALGAREIHVVSSQDRPWVGAAVRRATAERDDHGIRWVQHEAESRFVAGQSRAIVELLAGRPGLPVTSWAPEAVDGHRRRPTLLSNAESFAHLAAVVLWGVDAYAAHGTPEEPGTSLLTLTTPPGADGAFRGVHVVEVEHGEVAASVLDGAALDAPLLVGGFHGSWVHPRDVPALEWSTAALGEVGARLGAGALLSLERRLVPRVGDRPLHLLPRGRVGRAVRPVPQRPARLGRRDAGPGRRRRHPAPAARARRAGHRTRRVRPPRRHRPPGRLAAHDAARPRRGPPRRRLRVRDDARPPRAQRHECLGGEAMSPHETLLKVDWPQCRARGLCAELLPERIRVDEWGYPVVLGPVRPEEERLAREAVSACPRRALHLRTT